MRICKLLLMALVMVFSVNAFAQTPKNVEDQKVIQMREKLGVDYSMPDFDTKKIDGKIIGIRLAKMLESLQKNYTQGTYNRQLANIRYESTEDPKIRFLGVDKLKILRIKKEGTVITIRMNTVVKNEVKEKLQHEFDVVFDKGVSESNKVNNLFSDLSRYIKIDD